MRKRKGERKFEEKAKESTQMLVTKVSIRRQDREIEHRRFNNISFLGLKPQ